MQQPLDQQQDSTLNVLVIDDEPVARQLVRRLLRDAGIKANIEEIDTASDAIRVLSDKKFDIVLLDYRLPDGTATSILKTLRKYGRLHTPVVVMTAHGARESANESLNEGAQDYLLKDELTADNLERSIRYSMQRHKLSQELAWSKERERREKELRLLQSAVTESDTAPSTIKSLPETFERFVESYRGLLQRLLDESTYETEREVPRLAREFADELGKLRAGPKDVIDIHTRALKLSTERVSKQKENAIAIEGRILLIQVLGLLVTYYRN